MAVGARKGHRMIEASRLAELEERAQDGIDMRAALLALKPTHYEMMESLRDETPSSVRDEIGFARGWLAFEHELGEQLAIIARRRVGEPKPTDPVDEELGW